MAENCTSSIRSEEYYFSLAESIRWYRSRSHYDLEASARQLFQADVAIALKLYEGILFTTDLIPVMRRDVMMMFMRQKYRGMIQDQQIKFYLGTWGQPVFDDFDHKYLMHKYALNLALVTPDTEYLIRPYSGYEDVQPVSRSFKF